MKRRAILRRLALVGSGVGWGLALAAFIVLIRHDGGRAYDAHAYWLAGRAVLEGRTLYEPASISELGAYLYPPIFAQLWAPLALLPELAFAWAWRAVCFAALLYLAGSLRNVGLWFLLPLTIREISIANVTFPVAALTLAALRGRAEWLGLAALWKFGPALTGLYVLLVRPSQRRGLLAGGVAVGLACLVSFAIAPGAWFDYLRSLGWRAQVPLDGPLLVAILPTASADFALRFTLGLALILVAAWRGSDRLAYAVSILASPTLFLSRLSALLAVPRAAREADDRPRARWYDAPMPTVPPRLSLVIPAYNEAARIGPALDELFGYLRRPGPARDGGRPASGLGPVDVIVVDDGSDDGTAALVEGRPEAQPGPGGESPTLRVLRIEHGGKGAAVRAGMLAATGDLVIFTDADLATPPDQVPDLVDALRAADVALGSRVQPDGSDRRASQPLYRRLLGRAFRALARAWVSTGPVPDTQCGFKGFRREAAADLFARQRVTSIVFDVEIIHLARRRGYRIAVVPVHWSDKRGSRMRLRPGLALRVAWDLLRIPLLHRAVAARTEIVQGTQ
ncbi:MAG TPA: glycosyltransferase [Candidatus Limnocylindrales bacterium]|nr:glycosyltransferase [Candidatus Limnocylindrales bacterium]